MATFVLVPGFWLGAWAWDAVADHLRTAGHDVYAVTLTGLAERVSESSAEVNVDTHVQDLVRLIEDNDLADVVLVAHSGANMPVTGTADRIPERLARIVYVDSGPLPNGMAQFDFNDPRTQQEIREQVDTAGDGWRIPVPAFDPAADTANLAELSERHLADMRERGTPQPFGTATQPLYRPADIPDTPKTLVACTFTPDQVSALAESGNPIFALMSEFDVHHLPTGHWPMFSRPKELAAVLGEIAGS